VSKPSVSQPQTGARRACASAGRPWSHSNRPRLVAARSSRDRAPCSRAMARARSYRAAASAASPPVELGVPAVVTAGADHGVAIRTVCGGLTCAGTCLPRGLCAPSAARSGVIVRRARYPASRPIVDDRFRQTIDIRCQTPAELHPRAGQAPEVRGKPRLLVVPRRSE
jgi:hypothetical protein